MKKGKKGKRLEGARERQRNNGRGEKRKRDGCLAKNMDILKGVIIQHLMEISFYFSHTCGGSVAKSCLTLVTPWIVACRAPLSSAHGILQARILEQVTIFFSRGSSFPTHNFQ